jgi:hypothetical protein
MLQLLTFWTLSIVYNLTHGLLKKSKFAKHAYEEGHKICWKEAKVLQIEPNATHRNLPTCLWQLIRSVNVAWTVPPSGLQSLKQRSENYNSGLSRIYGKCCLSYVGTTQMPYLSLGFTFYLLLHSIWYIKNCLIKFYFRYLYLRVYLFLSYLWFYMSIDCVLSLILYFLF